MITRTRVNRRDFLYLAGLGAFALASSPARATARSAALAPAPLVDLDMELTASPGTANLVPGRATSTWAYAARVLAGDPSSVRPLAAGYLGPVIRAQRGQNLRVRFVNELAEPSIVHWHGLHVPADMDGHPRDVVPPGAAYGYELPIVNRAGTYWFHPHPHGRTGVQVYNGLAGLLLVSDDEEAAARLPAGDFDVPLVIQDRVFDATNQFVYPGASTVPHQDGALGDTILVNGQADFTLDVRKSVYRLRLLNASNARIYKLAWSDGTPLAVIATDGGLLETPVAQSYVTLAPGERVEVVADFRSYRKGTVLRMVSRAFAGADLGGVMSDVPLPNGAEFTVLRVRVRRRGPSAFAMLVLNLRQARNLKQSELAELSGVGRRLISDIERGARRHHPFLVAGVAVRRADARDDEEAVGPQGARRGDLGSRADHAVEPALARQGRQPLDLGVRIAADSDRGEIALVEAGEHGHADDLGALRCGGLGVFEHCPPAGGMDGEDRRFERPQCLDRLSDRVRDVVELEIEEDRQAELRHFPDAVAAVGGEELESELEAADVVAHPPGDGLGALQIRCVDGNEDRAFHDAGETVPRAIVL